MRSSLLLVVALVLLLTGSNGAPVAGRIPHPEIEDAYTLTPFGYMPRSCVHHVGLDAYVHQETPDLLKVVRADGHEATLPRCHTLAHLEARQKGQLQSKASFLEQHGVESAPNGWAAYTYYGPHAAFDFFGGSWTVPSAPKDQQTQTLFLFTGFQNEYDSLSPGQLVSIIQPVLQWGPSEAGGGSYWTIASWFVSSNGQAVYSTLKQVRSGERIVGNMTLTNQKWDIVAVSSAGATSGISVNPGVSETFAFVTLEVYSVADCGDYPNGSTTFRDLKLTSAKRPVTPTWTPEVQPGCEEAVQVVSPSQVVVKF